MTALLLACLLNQDPEPRSGVGAARIGPIVYVVGGASERNGAFVARLNSYNLGTKRWTEHARLPEPIAFPATIAYNGSLYIFGGLHTDNTHCSHAYVYDSATDRWTALANMPTARSRASVTMVQGKMAVIGGIAPEAAISKNSNRVELYDPAARTWSRMAPMPTPRHGHSSESVRDRLVVLGGYADDPVGEGTTTEVWSTGGGWTKGEPMPEKRGFPMSVAFDGEVWVFGSRSKAAHPVHYDPVANKWTVSKASDTPRHRGAAVEYQGKAYLFFGEGAAKAVQVFDLRRDEWVD